MEGEKGSLISSCGTETIEKNKLLIYNTIEESILFYEAEAWILKHKYKNKLFVEEMNYLRRSARISRLDKMKIT